MDREAYFWQVMDGKLPPPKVAETLGIRFVAIDAEAGTIEVEFDGKEAFLNPMGNVQGGILTAMLDDTMGPALAATLAAGEFAPTVNLNVQFFSPARVGAIQGKGRVERRGKDICYLSGELLQQGKIVAKATAVAIVRKVTD
jgi:uncharacterized protein (TIGR00369 family)